VSKLSTLVLKACRAAAGSSPWDALVAGEATGTLIQQDTLNPSKLQQEKNPVVLLLHRADGDEEIAGVGDSLKGIVLAQDLPHLSHLGVRARQEKMPFATLDDPQVVSFDVSPLLGQVVTLKVTPTGVTLTKASSAEAAAAASGSGKGKEKYRWSEPEWAAGGPPPEPYDNASLVDTPRVIPLLDCSTSLGGAKASACAQLEQVRGSGWQLYGGVNMNLHLGETCCCVHTGSALCVLLGLRI
jgi:phosphoglucan,water dikinase